MKNILRILLSLLLCVVCAAQESPVARQDALNGLGIRMAGYESVLGQYSERIGNLEEEATAQAALIATLKAAGAPEVDTFEQLTAAVSKGGGIVVAGEITLPETLTISTAGTRLVGKDRSAKLVRPHNGKGVVAIHIAAPRVAIEGLDITTRHPLTPAARGIQDIGITIASTAGVNVDDVLIRDCRIHHVFAGIWRYPGNSAAEPGRRWMIERNHISSFAHSGIYLNWRLERPTITGNVIQGRGDGDQHVVDFNGLWLGNFCDHAVISYNEVWRVDRHGIEVWNSATAPSNVGGNWNFQIIGNHIHDIGEKAAQITSPVGAFGITAFGNGSLLLDGNIVENYVGIGIELYNDKVNQGRVLLRGGIILGGRSAAVPTGITAHGLLEAEIEGVTIADLQSTTAGTESWGIDIRPFNGVGASGLRIHGCRFDNAGNRMVYLNGNGAAIFSRVNISRNEFHYRSLPWTVPSGQYAAVYLQRALSDVVMRDNESWYAASIGATVGGYTLEDASQLTAVHAGNATDQRIKGAFRSCQGLSNLHIQF